MKGALIFLLLLLLLLLGALTIVSRTIQIVQIVAIIQRRRLVTVHVRPVGADLQLLVEGSAVGAKEAIVLHLRDKRINSSM